MPRADRWSCYFHGGGWTLGALDQSDWLCSQVCIGVGAVVVSVDYRLAPSHRFPTAVIDSLAAVTWVAEHAGELGVDGGRIAVMGDSAGGNLATVVCQLLRDRGGPAITHQALLYPATDLRTPEDFDPAHRPAPTGRSCRRRSWSPSATSTSGPDGDADSPMASPILAEDLTGLPPALIQVAEYDPLRDDGIRYARALQRPATRSGSPSTSACRTATSAFPRSSAAASGRHWPSCAPSSGWRCTRCPRPDPVSRPLPEVIRSTSAVPRGIPSARCGRSGRVASDRRPRDRPAPDPAAPRELVGPLTRPGGRRHEQGLPSES